jgi:predicted nucleic acid-binding protein
MTVLYFLDTNILIYAALGREQEEEKRRRAAELMSASKFCLSAQVLQEFYSVATRPERKVRLSEESAVKWIERLEVQPCADITASLVKNAVLTSLRYKISYWDAAIIAAAEVLGAPILYTEDLNHGQAYGAVKVINPFIEPPAQPGFHDNKQTAFTKD